MRGTVIVVAALLAACGAAEPPAPASVAGSAAVAATTSLPPPPVHSPQTPATVRPSPTTATTATTVALPTTALPTTARVVLVGDVMLGRGVSRPAREDPEALFAGIADVISGADLAGANLESPLTNRPHIAVNTNAIAAPPERAMLLGDAGFDVAVVANNHATDSGRLTVIDTVAAVAAAGLAAVGGGPDRRTAFAPLVVEAGGVRVAFLAFDATLAGWPATQSEPGVAHWEPALAAAAVEQAAAAADVVIASVHGGIEYRRDTDRRMAGIAEQLAGWGADVVWGHGPHVVQPVYAIPGLEGRTAVVATSLGNFLFDMGAAGTQTGAVLEVEIGREGVVAYRVGAASHHDGPVVFDGWGEADGSGAGGWVVPGRVP